MTKDKAHIEAAIILFKAGWTLKQSYSKIRSTEQFHLENPDTEATLDIDSLIFEQLKDCGYTVPYRNDNDVAIEVHFEYKPQP